MSVKTYRRGVILICAALCGALTASLNIWSIFQKPLMEAYGFSPQSVSFAYTIVIAMIGLSGPIGGWLQTQGACAYHHDRCRHRFRPGLVLDGLRQQHPGALRDVWHIGGRVRRHLLQPRSRHRNAVVSRQARLRQWRGPGYHGHLSAVHGSDGQHDHRELQREHRLQHRGRVLHRRLHRPLPLPQDACGRFPARRLDSAG